MRQSLAYLKLSVLRNSHWLSLVLAGLTSQLLYIRFFLKPYPLLAYYAVPLLEMGKITRRSFEGAFDFATAFFLLFVIYYTGYVLCRGQFSRYGLIVVFLSALSSGLILMFVYPITAADIFDYVSEARILSHHGANPYLHPPADFPNDPFLPYCAWPWKPPPYGPLWIYIASGVTRLSASSLLANLLLFKGAALLIHLLNAGLIYGILARWRPSYALAGTLLFAWNPLILFESAANGHHDDLMMFFVLLAIDLYLRGKFALAVPAAMCSYLVKLPTIVLVPLFVVGGWRALSRRTSSRRFQFLIVSGLLTAALVLAFHAPLWEGLESVTWLGHQHMFTSSFGAVAALSLQQWMDRGLAQSMVRYGALLLFGLFYLWQIAKLRSHVRPFLFSLYWTVFIFLSVAVLWFQPWYLLWLIALGAILPSLAIANLTTLFSYTASWNYLVYMFFWTWYLPLMNLGDRLVLNLTSVLFIFVPPLTYALYIRGREGR